MEDRYYKNRRFSLLEKEGFYFGVDGKPVLHIDGIIGRVWDLCEGKTLEEIYHQINQETGVSRYLLKNILLLMIKGDLIQSATHGQEEDLIERIKREVGGPLVSIVILNFNGELHLRGCLDSIRSQVYQNLETIVIDNASEDQLFDLIRNEYPWVNLIGLKKNTGFATGNNVGIEQAKGEYILLLNNDAILDPYGVTEAMAPLLIDEKVAAVALKIRLYPLTRFINSLGNSLRDHSWGSDNYLGQLDLGQHDHQYEVFSACFAGVLLSRKAIEEVGFLDPDYFMYYEDMDWCFRARQLGWKIVTAPKAIVYHKFGTSSEGNLLPFKLQLVLINRIRFILKNLRLKTGWRWIKNFLKEDSVNLLNYLRTWEYPYAISYIKAYGRLTLLFPKEILKRAMNAMLQRKGLLEDSTILQFSLPKEESLVDSKNIPLFDVPTLRDYYLHLHPEIIELSRSHFNIPQKKSNNGLSIGLSNPKDTQRNDVEISDD